MEARTFVEARTSVEAPTFSGPDDVEDALRAQGYIADRQLATLVYLLTQLEKPLLVEGPAGVGKTELAEMLALATGRRLIRLQCYEGQDETKALYEWDYGKQLLYTQILREKTAQLLSDAADMDAAIAKIAEHDSVFFSERFLAERPLLEAIRSPHPVVLLVDEIDRADEALEAVLLELLAEFQVSVPEIGTFTAVARPYIVLTSNNTRDLSAALKRRCLHVSLDYPSTERELEIIRLKATGISEALTRSLVEIVRQLRTLDLRKPPSISETVDWARTLAVLNVGTLDASVLAETIPVILKYDRDVVKAMEALPRLVDIEGWERHQRGSHGPDSHSPDSHGHSDHDHGPHAPSSGDAPGSGDRLAGAPGAVRPTPGPETTDDGRAVRLAKDKPGRHGEGVYPAPNLSPFRRR